MPSSSNRSTYTELELVALYRITFARLWGSGLHVQAEYITSQFAELLDIDHTELASVLKPVYEPSRSSRASWMADIKQWNELQASNAKMRRSSKMNAAGNALADAGAELFRTGRKAEAIRFCEFGETIWGFAMDAFDEEEAVKNGGRWGHGDKMDVEP